MSPATAATTTSATVSVRLHISPLTPDTFPIIVPKSLQAAVSDVSYHQIPAFPDRAFGYIELPSDDADRLKKRLHGALIKGSSIQVQPARPRKGVDIGLEGIDTAETPAKELRLRASAEGLIRGAEIPSTRRVRRGWTQPLIMKRDKKAAKSSEGDKAKHKAKRSEYTDKEECLFKTKIKTGPKEGGKKRKRGDDTKVIHEFERTTKFPTFLRGQAGSAEKATAGYDAEKGWVDTEGNVVEKPRRSKRLSQDASAGVVLKPGLAPKSPSSKRLSVTSATKKLSLKGKAVPEAAEDDTSSSGSSDSEGEREDDDESDQNGIAAQLGQEKVPIDHEIDGDNDDAMSDARSKNSDSEGGKRAETPTKAKPTAEASSVKVLSMPEPLDEKEEKKAEVHPLEALFKKPKPNSRRPPNLELKIPFSFFSNNDDGSEDGDQAGELPTMPQTPYTQADMRFRRQRSAAPTPDTAAPTKLLFGPVLDRVPPTPDEDDPEDKEREPSIAGDASEQSKPKTKPSEFAEKWFWDNRGDNNRAWKRRRREVTKEQRHATNKRNAKHS